MSDQTPKRIGGIRCDQNEILEVVHADLCDNVDYERFTDIRPGDQVRLHATLEFWSHERRFHATVTEVQGESIIGVIEYCFDRNGNETSAVRKGTPVDFSRSKVFGHKRGATQ